MHATNVTIPQADPTPTWRVGAQVGVVAAVATELVGTVARAADVPMRAGNPGAHTATKIAVLGFAEPTLMCSVIGTVLAVVFARRARRPGHTFAATTIVLTAVSLISPGARGRHLPGDQGHARDRASGRGRDRDPDCCPPARPLPANRGCGGGRGRLAPGQWGPAA